MSESSISTKSDPIERNFTNSLLGRVLEFLKVEPENALKVEPENAGQISDRLVLPAIILQ